MIQNILGIYCVGFCVAVFILIGLDTSPKLSEVIAFTVFWPFSVLILGFKGLKELWELWE